MSTTSTIKDAAVKSGGSPSSAPGVRLRAGIAGLHLHFEHEIDQVTADGAYDGEPTYETIARNDPQIQVVIPPRVTALPSAHFETEPTRRDAHLLMIQSLGRLGWQEACGYGKRALVETTMGRYKAIIGRRAACSRLAGPAHRGGRRGGRAQPHAGCWTPELRPHFNRDGISRSGVGVTSPSA